MPSAGGPETTRLRSWLREARAGLGPGDRTPAATLADIGRRCGAGEIDDALAILDGLAGEKAALPEWDGDSADDVSAAQATYMRILGHVVRELIPAVATGLRSPEADTRRWVTLAIEMHGATALAFLRPAADTEPEATTRAFMIEAIARIESAGSG